MQKNWVPVGAAAVVAVVIAGYFMLSKSYPVIVVDGATYKHVEMTEVNKVENHFFTVGGVDVDESDGFLQVSKYDHPDLTPEHVRVVQSQVIHSFVLEPLESSEDRYFGVFRNTVPVYGFMGTNAFVLKVGPDGANLDDAEDNAAAMTDALSKIPTEF